MAARHANKSTNVRTTLLLLSALTVCAGCTSAQPLYGAQPGCGAGALRICEAFGPEQHCECAATNEVGRFLSSFGEPAWSGGARW